MYLREVLCTVCAIVKDQKVIELRLEPSGKKNILNNIYVGQIEKIATNIQAAFVRLNDSVNGYLPLNQCEHAIFTDGHREGQPLRPGDQILVQINRDAMKGKLPALTANLNFSGKFLVLTTGNRKIGISNKLSKEESSKLSKWLDDERTLSDRGYGLIARTNAADASKEEFFHELDKPNGGSMVAKVLIEDCTEVHLYVGKAINSAYQNPGLPFDLGIRQNLVEQLRHVIEEMGKTVVVTYY